MHRIKIQSNFTKSLVALLLILFVISRGFFALHAFSHQENSSAKVENAEQNFFAKIIFSHEKSSDKKSENCYLCVSANFQNQILLLPSLIFSAVAFYLAFALRNFDRVKLSYLLTSKAPRAPPVIS